MVWLKIVVFGLRSAKRLIIIRDGHVTWIKMAFIHLALPRLQPRIPGPWRHTQRRK
jgi:hypothetical protein